MLDVLNSLSHRAFSTDDEDSESKSIFGIGTRESVRPPLLCCRRCGYYSTAAAPRSVCGGGGGVGAAAIIFYFLAAPIERREREKGENGKEGERQTGKKSVRPSASVMDLTEGECKTKQKPQIDSSSERGGRRGRMENFHLVPNEVHAVKLMLPHRSIQHTDLRCDFLH